MAPRTENPRKVVLLVLLAGFAVTFVWYLYLWHAYYKMLPHLPDRAAGRVYADNFHGVVLYETRRQYVRLHTLEHAGEVLVLLIIVVGGLLDPNHLRKIGWRKNEKPADPP